MSTTTPPHPAFVREFRLLFLGRDDAHGQGIGRRVDEPVDDRLIAAHLTGERRIGIYLVSGPSRDKVHFAAIDIDIADWELALLLQQRLQHYGLPSWIERTKSKGWHVWLFFSAWVDAWKPRAIIRMVIEELGDRVPVPLEVFPKQDRVAEGGYGNYINLPLFGGDAPDGRTCFYTSGPDGQPQLVANWKPTDPDKISEHALDELIEMCELMQVRQSTLPRAYEAGADESPSVKRYDALLPCAFRMLKDGAREGMRNEWTFRLAIHMKRNGFGYTDTERILIEWNRQRCNPPNPDDELIATIRSAYDPKHKNESLGCDNPLILPVCVHGECPVYRKNHPTTNENAADAKNEIHDPKQILDVSTTPGTMGFRYKRGPLLYTIVDLDNRRGALCGIVMIEMNGETIYRGMVNLDSDSRRKSVDRAVFSITDGKVTDVDKDLMALGISINRKMIDEAKKNMEEQAKTKQAYTMTERETQEAVDFAKKDNRILWRVIEFTSRCGLVREKRNRLLIFLIGLSRKMEKPISGIGKGDSSSGKSHLASKIFQMLPEEDLVEFTRMTATAMEYRGEHSMMHKLLFIREAPGSEQAQHSLRTFISEGDLNISTVEKDIEGRLVSRDIKIRGPLAYYSTTTSLEMNPENETRYLPLYSDESESMTAACMVPTAYEAEFGKIVTPPNELRLWRNYQRTLKVDQRVVVPFAGELVEGFPTTNVRARRDFGRMLELIKVCAFAHQHHRDWQVSFDETQMPTQMVIASVADYEIVKSLVETAMMRVSKNIKPGQEQFIEKLSGLTDAMLDNHRRGESMPAKVHLEHNDEEGLVVWFEVPFLRDTLGKTHRSVYELVKALEEEGIVILTEKRRPIRVRLAPGFSNSEGGIFRLPTLDPEVLYQRYPENRKDQYDPLGAPDFEDIYGSPGHWIKKPDHWNKEGKK